MLLAVEGGGFFSSSASGYSKGLTLLLLGQKDEDKPIRVAPWNHYQLVDRESDPDLQLAPNKNRIVRGCASFVCFGRAAAGLETSSPLKVGPTQQQDLLGKSPDNNKDKEDPHTTDVVEDGNNTNVIALRSSLKRKPAANVPLPVTVSAPAVISNGSERLHQNGTSVPVDAEKRKVQWTDVSGGELYEIREFEPSENSGSDDEFENWNERACSCRIM